MKNRNKTSERGVAVLFSLGILGMMTVLALTFASVSMTNQTIARNATQQGSAKEMARSIVDRIQTALNYSGYTPGGIITTPTQLRNLYSKQGGTNSNHFDWIWKLGMTGTDIESALYRTDEVCNYSSPGTLPTWQYVTSNGKIIGRFAYVVRATDLPVIDLNTAFLKDDGSATSNTYIRRGNSLDELNPNIVYGAAKAQLFASAAYSDFNAIDSNLLTRAKNTLASMGRTTSYADFEALIPLQNMSDDGRKEVSKVIANSYSPRSVMKYPEVYLLYNTDAIYRFDLSQLSSLSGEANKRAMVEKMVGGSGTSLKAWNKPDDASKPDTTQIPWLANFTDSEGNYDDAKHKARQIAANIVDFFTTDDTPTSDVANGSWFNTTPKYIGLKETPFLYGFGGDVHLTVIQEEKTTPEPESTKYYEQTAAFKFTPYASICNFYSVSDNLQIGVKAQFKITFQISGSGISTAEKEIIIDYPEEGSSESFKILELNSGSSPTDIGYHKLDFKSKTVNLSEYTVAKNTTITMKSLGYVVKVGLRYKGKWVDFSEIRKYADETTTPKTLKAVTFNASSDPGNKKTINTSGKAEFNYPIAFKVSDPRHNLFEKEWGGRINTKNDGTEWITIFNVSAGTDNLYGDCVKNTPKYHDYLPAEAATQQAAYSAVPTPANAHVYFPTGSTRTPWEIGQIHRGYAWQTINLKKYNYASQIYGGTYSDGDANLLDQLRMTSDVSTYGKIPLNEIWGQNQALFEILQRKALTSGTTPSAGEGGNDEFRNTNFNLTPFFDTRKTAPPHYFTYRGELAKILTYSTTYHILASNPTSDAAREELFTKCAMLFDVEPTFLPRRVYVFGIAQTIKDVNGSVYKAWNNDGDFTKAGNTYSALGKYNTGYRTSPTSSGKDLSTPPNSGLLTSTYGNYVNGVDKILSEQKVFAILEREYTLIPYSSSNRPVWKIVRFEYVQ